MHAALVPHALTSAEIDAAARSYAQATRNAMEAGFDGVELHADDGYLIDQFLHASSNLRCDSYGGSAANRSHFLCEDFEAVMTEVGADRNGVRLSPFVVFNGVDDPDPAELFATAMKGLGWLAPAYMHVVNPQVSGDCTICGNTAVVDVLRFSRDHFGGTLRVAGGYEHVGGSRPALRRGRPHRFRPSLYLQP